MSKFKVGDMVITNENTTYGWGAGYKGVVVDAPSDVDVVVHHREHDPVPMAWQKWCYNPEMLDLIEPVKETIMDDIQFSEEIAKKVKRAYQVWNSGWTVPFPSFIDSITKRAPKCPVCKRKIKDGDIFADMTGWTATCRWEECPFGTSRGYEKKGRLLKQLEKYNRGDDHEYS